MASIALKHATGNSTSLHSPAANPSANVTLKVPSTTGSAGQALKVASANHSSTNAELEWGGAGKILQVATVSKTDTTSTDSASWVDITGMSVAMTPASGTKILINVSVNWGADVRWGIIRLLRDSTAIAVGTSPSNREAVLFQCAGTDALSNNEETLFNNAFSHLDTHGADGSTAVTYKLQWQVSYSSGNTIYLNRSHSDSDSAFCSRGSSSIVLQEVGS